MADSKQYFQSIADFVRKSSGRLSCGSPSALTKEFQQQKATLTVSTAYDSMMASSSQQEVVQPYGSFESNDDRVYGSFDATTLYGEFSTSAYSMQVAAELNDMKPYGSFDSKTLPPVLDSPYGSFDTEPPPPPKENPTKLEKGIEYLKQKKYDHAKTIFLEIGSTGTDDPISQCRAYSNLGTLYFETHEYEQALRAYEKSLTYVDSKNFKLTIINNLILTACAAEQWDMALSYSTTQLSMVQSTYNQNKIKVRMQQIQSKLTN